MTIETIAKIADDLEELAKILDMSGPKKHKDDRVDIMWDIMTAASRNLREHVVTLRAAPGFCAECGCEDTDIYGVNDGVIICDRCGQDRHIDINYLETVQHNLANLATVVCEVTNERMPHVAVKKLRYLGSIGYTDSDQRPTS